MADAVGFLSANAFPANGKSHLSAFQCCCSLVNAKSANTAAQAATAWGCCYLAKAFSASVTVPSVASWHLCLLARDSSANTAACSITTSARQCCSLANTESANASAPSTDSQQCHSLAIYNGFHGQGGHPEDDRYCWQEEKDHCPELSPLRGGAYQGPWTCTVLCGELVSDGDLVR
jgi:hypothetical protein